MRGIGKSIWDKLRNKSYRQAYVSSHIRYWIANQITTLRKQEGRAWSKGEFAKRLDKPQSIVTRLEDPNYGKLTVRTLLEIAEAFDVALIIKFVDHAEFLRETSDVSESAMRVESFNEAISHASASSQTKEAGVLVSRPHAGQWNWTEQTSSILPDDINLIPAYQVAASDRRAVTYVK